MLVGGIDIVSTDNILSLGLGTYPRSASKQQKKKTFYDTELYLITELYLLFIL